MVNAIKAYQRASDAQSLIDVTQGEQNMTNAWMRLTKQEQDAVGNQYPGIVQLMTAQPAYGYGGGYWPYYR